MHRNIEDMTATERKELEDCINHFSSLKLEERCIIRTGEIFSGIIIVLNLVSLLSGFPLKSSAVCFAFLFVNTVWWIYNICKITRTCSEYSRYIETRFDISIAGIMKSKGLDK